MPCTPHLEYPFADRARHRPGRGLLRTMELDLPPFTLVGAASNVATLTSPIRERFGMGIRGSTSIRQRNWKPSSHRSAGLLNVAIEPGGAI